MIPAQAVDAAKEAMREVTPPPGISKADWLAEHGEFALIAGAIAAAAPYMLVHVHHHDIEHHARSFNEGYEAAVTQGLADDPTLAQDWLDDKLATAWDEGRQAGHDHMIGKQSTNPYRSEA